MKVKNIRSGRGIGKAKFLSDREARRKAEGMTPEQAVEILQGMTTNELNLLDYEIEAVNLGVEALLKRYESKITRFLKWLNEIKWAILYYLTGGRGFF